MPVAAELEKAIQRGKIPFMPFAHLRQHLETVARGKMPATPFTTFYDLFGEDQDTPRLHLFSSKTYRSRTSEPYLFRRREVKPSYRSRPQVTFAGISGKDGEKKIGIYVHEQNLLSAKNTEFNYTVISNIPNHPETTIIPRKSPQSGSITITYLEHPDETFALRCGEHIFAMASLGTLPQRDGRQPLGMRIAIFPDVLIKN